MVAAHSGWQPSRCHSPGRSSPLSSFSSSLVAMSFAYQQPSVAAITGLAHFGLARSGLDRSRQLMGHLLHEVMEPES